MRYNQDDYRNDPDFQELLQEQQSQKIIKATGYHDRSIDIAKNGSVNQGYDLPWTNQFFNVRLRLSEMSIVGAPDGAGKSTLTLQILNWLLPQEKCLLVSLEMPIENSLALMRRQASGRTDASRQWHDKYSEFLDERLYVYDHLGVSSPEDIFALIEYSAKKYGVKFFIIDNLMLCLDDDQDWSGQGRFSKQIQALSKRLDVHIMLVVHTRKLSAKNAPEKADIRGNSSISNNASTVILLHRNLAKEQKINDGEDVSGLADAKIICEKQRNFSWTGSYYVNFHKESAQFIPTSKTKPIPWTVGGVMWSFKNV